MMIEIGSHLMVVLVVASVAVFFLGFIAIMMYSMHKDK